MLSHKLRTKQSINLKGNNEDVKDIDIRVSFNQI
jgi:hypothetical protein